MIGPQSNIASKTTAVQRLFVQHHLALRSFICALVPDFNVAQDVLQETFLTVTAKAGEFSEGSNFVNWACTIARFKVLETLRARKLKSLSPAALESLCAVEVHLADDPRIDVIERCISELAPRSRRIVELRYEGDHSPSEVARVVGWTVKAVNVTLSRARRVLRDCVRRKLAATCETGGGPDLSGCRP
jgi:RNA polymerase sigma-70 factor, ECF subfamily